MSDRRATIWTALRATAGVAGLSLAGSQIGFGAFAHGAGLSLFEVVFITVVIWALPAQVILIGALSTGIGTGAALAAVSISSIRLLPMVCSILPLMRSPRMRLWQSLIASHFVAQTGWILGFLHLHDIARDQRPTFFFAVSAILVGSSMAFAALGWYIAGALPFPLAVALLMLTPASFLLLTEKAARRPDEKIAMALGIVLLPIVHETAPLIGLGDWDLLITGIVGGLIAFAIGLSLDRSRPA
ncbi:MAG: AzlC family ABC transporter permease [Labrys sp. (in: a-proteobacteria)]